MLEIVEEREVMGVSVAEASSIVLVAMLILSCTRLSPVSSLRDLSAESASGVMGMLRGSVN